jgi:hypothetical protein
MEFCVGHVGGSCAISCDTIPQKGDGESFLGDVCLTGDLCVARDFFVAVILELLFCG